MNACLDLHGKVAFISGGTRGIGRAIALQLASQGASLALNYLRNGTAARQTAADIRSQYGTEPLLLKGNVGDPEMVATLANQALDHFGRMDILISNAASGVLRPAMELTARHLQWTMEINVHSLLFLAQQFVPAMRQQGQGKIVAVSSLGSTRAFPFYSAVGASKGALESLVRHLSVELAAEGINVNTVSAGVVDTEALQHFPNREHLLRESLRQTPAARLVQPEDVAQAVLFLCSGLASMIHGQTLVVDGGYSMAALAREAL